MKVLLTIKHVIFLMKLKCGQTKKAKMEIFEQLFELAGISPVKKYSKHSHTLLNEVKRQVESTHSIMQKSASAFLIEPTEKVFPTSEVSKNILDKGHCFDHLVDLVKEKLAISNNKQQIQVTWSIRYVVEVLETTEDQAKKAWKI